nr:hypothetical protein [Mesorhizobium sp.]
MSCLAFVARGDEKQNEADAQQPAHRHTHGLADDRLEIRFDAIGVGHPVIGEIPPDPCQDSFDNHHGQDHARLLAHQLLLDQKCLGITSPTQ